jgi:hypothetical protein
LSEFHFQSPHKTTPRAAGGFFAFTMKESFLCAHTCHSHSQAIVTSGHQQRQFKSNSSSMPWPSPRGNSFVRFPCFLRSRHRRPRLVRNLTVGFQSDPYISSIKTSTMITSANFPSRGSGMPNQVHGALVHAMSGYELYGVRTEL